MTLTSCALATLAATLASAAPLTFETPVRVGVRHLSGCPANCSGNFWFPITLARVTAEGL